MRVLRITVFVNEGDARTNERKGKDEEARHKNTRSYPVSSNRPCAAGAGGCEGRSEDGRTTRGGFRHTAKDEGRKGREGSNPGTEIPCPVQFLRIDHAEREPGSCDPAGPLFACRSPLTRRPAPGMALGVKHWALGAQGFGLLPLPRGGRHARAFSGFRSPGHALVSVAWRAGGGRPHPRPLSNPTRWRGEPSSTGPGPVNRRSSSGWPFRERRASFSIRRRAAAPDGF